MKLPKAMVSITAFLSVLQNVPTDNRLWEETSELAWELDRKGWVIPALDIVIACSAKRIGAAVLTTDKHFEKIPGLAVQKWPGR